MRSREGSLVCSWVLGPEVVYVISILNPLAKSSNITLFICKEHAKVSPCLMPPKKGEQFL